MKIGFFLRGDEGKVRPYLAMARAMMASAREVMPGVEVLQLTDTTSKVLPGVDGAARLNGAMPMAVMRMTLQANCDGDWLFVDPDILFQRDVREVFQDEFDVAVTDRAGTWMEGTGYAAVMPFNTGVTFSRSPRFWRTARDYLLTLPPAYQEWEGDQHVICQMVTNAEELGLNFDVRVLPGAMYNYPPRNLKDNYSEAAIVHFKGATKSLMLERSKHDVGAG